MPEYDVTIPVAGFMSATFTADNEEQALEKACEQFGESGADGFIASWALDGLTQFGRILRKPQAKERLSAGALAARRRPGNYALQSAEGQWAIDKELGILDWDGK